MCGSCLKPWPRLVWTFHLVVVVLHCIEYDQRTMTYIGISTNPYEVIGMTTVRTRLEA